MSTRCRTNDEKWNMSIEITDIWPRKEELNRWTYIHIERERVIFKEQLPVIVLFWLLCILNTNQFRFKNSIRSLYYTFLMDMIFFSKSLSLITRSQRLSLKQGQVVNILFLCLTSQFPSLSSSTCQLCTYSDQT